MDCSRCLTTSASSRSSPALMTLLRRPSALKNGSFVSQSFSGNTPEWLHTQHCVSETGQFDTDSCWTTNAVAVYQWCKCAPVHLSRHREFFWRFQFPAKNLSLHCRCCEIHTSLKCCSPKAETIFRHTPVVPWWNGKIQTAKPMTRQKVKQSGARTLILSIRDELGPIQTYMLGPSSRMNTSPRFSDAKFTSTCATFRNQKVNYTLYPHEGRFTTLESESVWPKREFVVQFLSKRGALWTVGRQIVSVENNQHKSSLRHCQPERVFTRTLHTKQFQQSSSQEANNRKTGTCWTRTVCFPLQWKSLLWYFPCSTCLKPDLTPPAKYLMPRLKYDRKSFDSWPWTYQEEKRDRRKLKVMGNQRLREATGVFRNFCLGQARRFTFRTMFVPKTENNCKMFKGDTPCANLSVLHGRPAQWVVQLDGEHGGGARLVLGALLAQPEVDVPVHERRSRPTTRLPRNKHRVTARTLSDAMVRARNRAWLRTRWVLTWRTM